MSRLHADALGVLSAWEPPTAEQARLRDRYVAHLDRHPDGMTRACFPDHLTAGTLVLSADGDAVLLNLHRKAGRWFHFGGHCEDGDDSLAAVAEREAREESGLDGLALTAVPLQLSEHTVAFCDPRGPVQHLDVRYAAIAPEGAVPATSEESLDVRWWRLDDPDLPDLEPELLELAALARDALLPRG